MLYLSILPKFLQLFPTPKCHGTHILLRILEWLRWQPMLYLGLEVANYGISNSVSFLDLFKSHLYVLKPSVNLLFLVIHLFCDLL